MMSMTALCLLAILLPAIVLAEDLSEKTCSRDNSVSIQKGATAHLGGIVSISEPGEDGYGCSPPYKYMQAIEGIRWALDLLNKVNETISTEFVTDYYVPGITLGMELFDNCGNSEKAVASLGSIYSGISSTSSHCAPNDKLVFGVVGTTTSQDALSVSQAGETYFNIPLVSFQADDPSITLSKQNPYFMRTIAPEDRLMEIIVEVLGYLKWEYVAVLYENNPSGRQTLSEFHSRYVAAGHCLTASIPFDPYKMDDFSVDSVLTNLLSTQATGVVYFGSNAFAKALIKRGDAKMPESGRLQWMMNGLELDDSFEGTNYQKGVISVSVASRFIVEFEDHWYRLDPLNPPAENPWFQSWYEKRHGCSVNPGRNQRDCATIYGSGLTEEEKKAKELLLRADYVQDPYVEPAIMAVFTYANALRRAQRTKCPSTNGPCAALLSMSREEFFNDYVKTVDFTFTSDERVPSLASNFYEPYLAAKHLSFDDNGDIENPSFYIWNYNDIETGAGPDNFKFRRVGTHINGKLDMNMNNVGMYNNQRNQRIVPFPSSLCPAIGCTPCIGLPADTKYFYTPGDIVINSIFSLHHAGPEPFSCGSLLNPNQVLYVEVLNFLLKTENSVLPGITIGGLGIDDCSSSAFSTAFISQVQKGSLKIDKDGGNILDPSSIKAYTGAYTTPLTIPVANFMNALKRPLVGYRAGGSDLLDTEKYPYYYFPFGGLRDEMVVIVSLLKKYEWNHVQVVVSDMPYSKDAEALFRELSAKAGICIVAKHDLGTSEEQARQAVRGLSVGGAEPTVVLLDKPEIRRLLMALDDNPSARSRIELIATSRWGDDKDLVKGYESTAHGVITLRLPRSSVKQAFMDHLRALRYGSGNDNPWFDEWFQSVYNCTPTSCDSTAVITLAQGYKFHDQAMTFYLALETLMSTLGALHEATCGRGTSGLCSNFISAINNGDRLMEELRKTRDTNRAFAIFNYQTNKYAEVGVAEPVQAQDLYDLNLFSEVKLYDQDTPSSTSCAQPCIECLYMFNHQPYLYVPGDLLIGAIFNIHYAGDGPFTCGEFRLQNGAVYSEVVQFAVNRVNQRLATVSPNDPIRLGILGFDGCSNPTRALAILNRAKTGLATIGPERTDVEPKDIVAWLTYDSATTESSATFLQKLGVPLVSPGATDPILADKDKYTTLFRTVPSDAIVAKGMADFANTNDWRYVLVVTSPDDASRRAADKFREYLKDFGICVVARYEFETDGNMDVILNSLVSFDTDVVAVFSEADMYIDEFLKAKTDRDLGLNLRFIANRRLASLNFQFQNKHLNNSVFFELHSPTISEFYDYLETRNILSSNNPWLKAIYEEIFDCNLPGSFEKDTRCQGTNDKIISARTKDVWNLPTIHAVTAIASALHETLMDKCGNAYKTVCPSFKHDNDTHQVFMSNMDKTSFLDIVRSTFKFVEREADRGYELFRYQYSAQPEREGSLSHDGRLTLTNEQDLKALYTDVKSECPDECLVCRDLDGDLREFSFIPGGVYIVGLFDVHKKGTTPFTCGDINDNHGMQLLEAFNFAIDYVNRGEGIFKDRLTGFTLGGIGLDICQSPARAANLVANIQSGNFELTKGAATVGTRSIEAYIGTMDSESSVRVADILSQIQIPQISYGAKGMELLNMEKYDYFLRSVPADDKQARAVVSYLKKFKYNNIQLIHSYDEIGEPGGIEFERLSEVNLVCVTKNHTIGVTDDVGAEAKEIVEKITKDPNAEVVVLWLKNPMPILEAAAANPAARNRILFIATDKWGMHPELLTKDSLRPLLEKEHLVVLDVETADIPEFDMYLEKKHPGDYTRNPWFKEYFESKFSCVWDAQLRAGEKRCSKTESVPRAEDYIQDPYVLYVINAVFSVAKAIDTTVKEVCEETGNDFGLCGLYLNSGERRQKVLKQMRKVRFIDSTHQPFFYTNDGQSDRGFHIYNVTNDASDPNGFVYNNIGSYNDTDFLKLDIRYDSDYQARCDPDGKDPNLEHCVCPFDAFVPSRFMKKDNNGRGLTLAYVGDIHQPHPDDKFACGPINTGVDLQRMLAFFYAVDLINSNDDFNFPDSIRFDAIALDSCTNGVRLGQDVYNLLSGNPLCDTDETGTIVSPSSIVGFVVDQNHNAMPISNMLALEDVITISPTASSAALDDQFRHPFFIRTTGGNQEQAKVIVDLMGSNQWDLMSVIYTDNDQHRASMQDLLTESQKSGSCVGHTSALSLDATMEDIRQVLNDITHYNGLKAVALFLEPAQIRQLLQASRELRLNGEYIWILPPNWETQTADLSGFGPELRGSLAIQHRSGILEKFIDYMTKMTFTNRLGIPDDWFEEIYETLHKCHILNREGRSTSLYTSICTQDEVITRDMISRDQSVLHVILSVYSMAHGLNSIPACSGIIDVAGCLQLLDRKTPVIYQGILRTNLKVFPDELGNDTFDLTYSRDGNGQPGYYIKFYDTDDSGRLFTQDLGVYTSQGLSNIDWTLHRQELLHTDLTSSSKLSSNCPLSTICKCHAPEGAFWQLRTSGSEKQLGCDRIGEIYRNPDTGEQTVLMKPGKTDRFDDTWAIILTVVASVGAFVALVLFIYLLVMYPVRGGTSILGYILSFGIILLYLMVFPFIAHADSDICGLRRFGLGLVYAIVYSALLVKLVDCWRVRGKNDSYNVKYSKLGRPAGLFFITVLLVLVQVIINTEWLILEQPDVECVFYKDLLWPRCTPDDFYDEGLVLSLCYIMVLIVFSFILGLITFTSFQNHREPRWILAIFSLSIPCWIIWCWAATKGELKMRDAAVSVGLIVNATIILLFVPVRKLYLLHKYNVLIEEEEKLANEGDYNDSYGHQYDNTPRMQDTGSVRASSVGGPRAYVGSGTYYQ